MGKILITGAGGLIGSHLVYAMANDWEIYAIYRKMPDLSVHSHSQGLKFPSIHPVLMDFTDSWNPGLLPDQINAVVHLAQSPNFRDFPDFAENIFSVNTSSTMHLLDYARKAGAESFILASSGGIYGHGDKEFSEDHEVFFKNELGFYLGSKFCAELIAENYSSFMNVIILRFFFVYGPGQRKQMLIPRLLISVINKQPIQLQGENGISINPIYVQDAVDAIVQSVRLNSSHKINIGGEEILTLKQIGEIIGKTAGENPVFRYQTNTLPKNLIADTGKMRNLLGVPKVNFNNGIKLLFENFLAHK